MHTTTMKKKDNMTLLIPAVKRANFLPIQSQIMLVKQSQRYDKSRNRAKQKRTWKEG